MQTYLMTRGTARSSDYRFLVATPSQHWWLKLGDRVILEEPEVIVARRDDRTNVLISGIPSDRRDVIGTAVRYTIVVDGIDEDADLLVKIATIATSADGRRALGRELDKHFDAGTVDAVFAGESPGRDLPGLAQDALMKVAVDEVVLDPDADYRVGSWVGSASDPASRRAFLDRVRGLATEDSGTAFTSHALSSADGAQKALRGLPGDVFILIVDGTVEELVELGNPAAPSDRNPPALPGRLVLVASAVLLVGLAGWAVISWIIRRLS